VQTAVFSWEQPGGAAPGQGLTSLLSASVTRPEDLAVFGTLLQLL
jgi:hypothetical protein